jgi:hypothetical protein
MMLAIRHGYTLTDLDRIARYAVHVSPVTHSYSERCEIALSAIAVQLYESADPVTANELLQHGRRAILADLKDQQRHEGYYRAHTDGGRHGPGSSPAFVTFWSDAAKPAGSPERYVLDGLAVRQILPELTRRERDALVALAVHDTYQAAAEAMGIEYNSFKALISKGRRKFLALWHEGEVPSRPWGVDRRAGVTSSDRRTGGGRSAVDVIVRRRRLTKRRRAA